MSNKKLCLMTFAVVVMFFFAASIFITQSSSDSRTHLLKLPPREQWQNGHGYCGETSIQTDALYFGTYISQKAAREIAGGELLVSENDDELLCGLKLNFEEWDYNGKTPQYEDFLVWTKKHLQEAHPVIITVYVKGMDDPDYDHIIPVVGYESSDSGTFHGKDQLIFNDNFETKTFTRTFDSLWDYRSMKRNQGQYEYCIPRDVDYGVAITGIVDTDKETVPVSLSVDSWNEPNVTLGEKPAEVNATIHIRSLVPGRRYALLKYTDYSQIPDSGFIHNSENIIQSFVAKKSEETISDHFMSDTLAAYRCVEAEE